MKNPIWLQELLHGVSEDIVVDPAQKAEFLKNPAVAAFRRDVLGSIEDTWTAILRARSWEEFCSLRGAYKALEVLLELPGAITVETKDSPATEPAVVESDLAKMKEILDGNATR